MSGLAAILPAARQSNHRIAKLSEFATRRARSCAVWAERRTHADRQIQIARSVRQKTPGHGRDTALRAANFKGQVRLVGEPTHRGLDPQNPDRKLRESLRRQRGTLLHARNHRWAWQAPVATATRREALLRQRSLCGAIPREAPPDEPHWLRTLAQPGTTGRAAPVLATQIHRAGILWVGRRQVAANAHRVGRGLRTGTRRARRTPRPASNLPQFGRVRRPWKFRCASKTPGRCG